MGATKNNNMLVSVCSGLGSGPPCSSPLSLNMHGAAPSASTHHHPLADKRQTEFQVGGVGRIH